MCSFVGKEKQNIELAKKTQELLGDEVLTVLNDWYRYTLQDNWDYVVFIVRRSYLVALIMQDITGLEMEEESKATFMTDSSFLLYCESFADYYKVNGFFPQILLNDDILIHGRNMNNVIRMVEDRLIELMPDVDENTIKASLTDAITINVGVQAEVGAPLLLDERYWLRLKSQQTMEQVLWRKMSSDLSTLILQSDYVNASYIYSEFVPRDSVKHIISTYKKSIYQNTIQYTKVTFSMVNNSVRAICTMRLIEDKIKSGYDVVPLVFLPNLDENETMNILKEICMALEEKQYDRSFIEMLKSLAKIKGKRSLNEWITFLLSMVLLGQFNEENKITISSDKLEKTITKLARNYQFTDLETSKYYLRECIKNPIFQNVNIMEQKLFLSDIYKREIVELSETPMKDMTSNMIRIKLDDFFYFAGKKEEVNAVEKLNDSVLYYGRGCCFVLKELLTGFSYEQAQIAVAYILQMMDAGILSLSSFAPAYMQVEGFAQFAKAGEQSLLVKVLRNIEYIPCMALIYEWCRQIEINFYDYFSRYMQSEECDIDRSQMDELISMIRDMESMNQTPKDWNANFMTKYDIPDNENRRIEIAKLSRKRSQHAEAYMMYNDKTRKCY